MEWPCWCASHFRDRWAIQNTSLDVWICWDLYNLYYLIYWGFWYPIIWERKTWSKVGILAGSKITDFKHIMMLYAIVILHHHVQHKFIYVFDATRTRTLTHPSTCANVQKWSACSSPLSRRSWAKCWDQTWPNWSHAGYHSALERFLVLVGEQWHVSGNVPAPSASLRRWNRVLPTA